MAVSPGSGFPRSARLLNAADYRHVFTRAEKRASHRQLLILARTGRSTRPRLGLVIAKKHVRLASARNRLKRVIRESFRQHQANLPPLDLVVLARPGLGNLDNAELQRLLARSWQRLRQNTATQGENRRR